MYKYLSIDATMKLVKFCLTYKTPNLSLQIRKKLEILCQIMYLL